MFSMDDKITLPSNSLIQYIFRRERSCYEVFLYLQQKFPDLEPANIINDLKDLNYLNDEKFAKNRISYRINVSHWGDNKIRRELQFLKIESAIIKNEFSQIEELVWSKVIKKIIKPLLRSSLAKDELKKKAYQKLLNKGFSLGLLQKTMPQNLILTEQELDE